jgi:hypothetical protein
VDSKLLLVSGAVADGLPAGVVELRPPALNSDASATRTTLTPLLYPRCSLLPDNSRLFKRSFQSFKEFTTKDLEKLRFEDEIFEQFAHIVGDSSIGG